MENCKYCAFRHCNKSEVIAHMIKLHKNDTLFVI